MNFPAYVLFTDEVTFNKKGTFNLHNTHLWTQENPHDVRHGATQKSFHRKYGDRFGRRLFNWTVFFAILHDHCEASDLSVAASSRLTC